MTDDWKCPNCSAEFDSDLSREECWDCGLEGCELCMTHTDDGIACEEHA